MQAGNVGCPANAPPSRVGRYGRVSQGLQQDLGQGVNGFPPENFRILHGYREAGVVSMMKDNTNKGLQDSRFFVTLKPDASWADGKYVAFGRVSKGLELIQAMAVVPVEPPANYPLSRIRIVDCGVY